MSFALQGSLLDLAPRMELHDLGTGLSREPLAHGAWVDLRPGWLTGADELCAALLRDVPWQAERRQMYDTLVDVPRLTRFYGAGEPLPHPVLVEAREMLSDHYEGELGERFATAGLCLYRDGRDSVAWHGDRIGRSRDQDTMVAILSVGSPRPLALRPRVAGAGRAGGGRPGGGRAGAARAGGGRAGGDGGDGGGRVVRHGSSATMRLPLGHGDLVVMGGSCQRTWDHAIPKTAKDVGPRISIQYRVRGVR